MAKDHMVRRYAPEYTSYHPRDVSITRKSDKIWKSITMDRKEWGLVNGVHPNFLPFAFSGDDTSFDVLLATANYIESREPHQQRITTTRLRSITASDVNSASFESVRDAMLLRGWWAGGEMNSTGVFFLNPEYVHPLDDYYLTAADRDERRKYLYIAAAYYRSPLALGTAFGYRGNSDVAKDVTKYARNAGIPWTAERERGRRQMGRTIKTLRAWGYSGPTIAYGFNLSDDVTYRLTDLVEEFHPPEDPTYRRSDDEDAPEWVTCAGDDCRIALVTEPRGPNPISLPDPAPDADGPRCFSCTAKANGEEPRALQPSYRPPSDRSIPTLDREEAEEQSEASA